MSLWNKGAAEITFADIDAFCKTMQPEGARLDYKGIAFPKDLAKTIAAFANTLGGLIILGVDADKTSNMPIWPPKQGLPSDPGLAERVIQIAQDAIYPPIQASVSNVIENDLLPGHSLLVIRIHESRKAPHAIEKNRKVYIYDRTENKNEPYDLADMERIEHLLARRQKLVDQRESELRDNLDRARRVMFQIDRPKRWISIAPVFPWKNVRDQYDCKVFHQNNSLNILSCHPTYQAFAGGSFSIVKLHPQHGVAIPVGCSSVSSQGALFAMSYSESTLSEIADPKSPSAGKENGFWIDMNRIREIVEQFLIIGERFYTTSKNPPGEVMLSIGVSNAYEAMMHDSQSNRRTDSPFPDNSYRIDQVLQAEGLGPSSAEIEEVYRDIKFAFNADARAM